MGFPCMLFVIFACCFQYFSLYLIFVNLINTCLLFVSWIYPLWDCLCFLLLGGYFISSIKEVYLL